MDRFTEERIKHLISTTDQVAFRARTLASRMVLLSPHVRAGELKTIGQLAEIASMADAATTDMSILLDSGDAASTEEAKRVLDLVIAEIDAMITILAKIQEERQ